MQITISIDCTAQEAREMLGLPNVKKVQDEWLEKVGANIFADSENFAPDKILGSWISGASSNADMLTGLFNTFVQSAGKPK